jgi:hypothetical protein
MYVIYRKGKRFNNKMFDSYEAARSYVRKWVRKNLIDVGDDYSRTNHRNPSLMRDYFEIKLKG